MNSKSEFNRSRIGRLTLEEKVTTTFPGTEGSNQVKEGMEKRTVTKGRKRIREDKEQERKQKKRKFPPVPKGWGENIIKEGNPERKEDDQKRKEDDVNQARIVGTTPLKRKKGRSP